MKYSRLKIVVFGCLLTLLVGILGRELIARAHAEIERSEPAANAVIPTAPAEVHIWFTQELFRRKGANLIEVSGPDGAQVDQGDTRIDDDDRKHAIVSLQPELPKGVYTVRWRNASVEDGHEGSGEFSFTVDPSATESSPVATQAPPTAIATPSADPTAAPLSTPTPPTSSGLPCLSGFLLGGVFMMVITTGHPRRGTS